METTSCLGRTYHRHLLNLSFDASFRQANTYYSEKLMEINDKFSLLRIDCSELLRIAIKASNVEMTHKLIKQCVQLADLDYLSYSPLHIAITCQNLEIICMLLYYGCSTSNYDSNLSAFAFSIICQCSEEIQRILIEYETDYNLCFHGDSTLFLAVTYRSPLVFDLLERGANPSYTKYTSRGNIIALFLAIVYNPDMELIRVSKI